MIDQKLSTLHHMLAIRRLLPRFNATAAVDLGHFTLNIRARGKHCRLFPQFIIREHERISYLTKPEGNPTGLIGWRPYLIKRWPAGCGKFAFKDFCAAHNLLTPRYSRSSPADLHAFVVKDDDSSFGRSLRGPFGRHDASDPAQQLSHNGYYEEFIFGRIVKLWYWNDRLLCMESQPMPTVVGDGKTSIRDLVCRSGGVNPSRSDLHAYTQVLAFQDKSLDDVPQEGLVLLADFRYGTLLNRASRETTSMTQNDDESQIVRQIKALGPTFSLSIPPEQQGTGTLFTVDAIADDEGKVWLLEMNCNPQVHPEAYLGMFESLFGAANPVVQLPPSLSSSAFRPDPRTAGLLTRFC